MINAAKVLGDYRNRDDDILKIQKEINAVMNDLNLLARRTTILYDDQKK